MGPGPQPATGVRHHAKIGVPDRSFNFGGVRNDGPGHHRPDRQIRTRRILAPNGGGGRSGIHGHIESQDRHPSSIGGQNGHREAFQWSADRAGQNPSHESDRLQPGRAILRPTCRRDHLQRLLGGDQQRAHGGSRCSMVPIRIPDQHPRVLRWTGRTGARSRGCDQGKSARRPLSDPRKGSTMGGSIPLRHRVGVCRWPAGRISSSTLSDPHAFTPSNPR